MKRRADQAEQVEPASGRSRSRSERPAGTGADSQGATVRGRTREGNRVVITVSGRPEKLAERIRRVARAVLRTEGVRRAALDVAVVGDARMRRENSRWLGEEGVTDVLAFDLREEERSDQIRAARVSKRTKALWVSAPKKPLPHPDVHRDGSDQRGRGSVEGRPRPWIDGQVIVCRSVARRKARARGADWQKELLLYVVHGCLHLCGYDDERSEDAERMHRREDEILTALGLGAVFSGGPARSRQAEILRGVQDHRRTRAKPVRGRGGRQ